MLGWKGVTDVLEEATGEQADHFKERLDIHFPFRTSVTKGKSKIRQNRGHQSHGKACLVSGVMVWEYLKAEVMEQVKRQRELNMFFKSLSGGLHHLGKH